MPVSLPERVDPIRLAGSSECIIGSLSCVALPRIVAATGTGTANDRRVVSVFLQFGIDEQGHKNVTGSISAELCLCCQRCMQPMEITIDGQISLGLVGSEQEAEILPSRYDPLVLSGPELGLATLVEDELILALPIVSRHELGDKRCKPACFDNEVPEAIDRRGQESPFAILASLKNDSES